MRNIYEWLFPNALDGRQTKYPKLDTPITRLRGIEEYAGPVGSRSAQRGTRGRKNERPRALDDIQQQWWPIQGQDQKSTNHLPYPQCPVHIILNMYTTFPASSKTEEIHETLLG